MTAADGSVLNRYSYLPFGEILSATEGVANPFSYIGALGVMDEDNGLSFMRNRFYQAQVGTFTSIDPLRFPAGDDYTYALNNPLQFVDPLGLISLSDAYSSVAKDQQVKKDQERLRTSKSVDVCTGPNCTAIGIATQQRESHDPNDIVGSAGFGTDGFLPPDQTLGYTIRFENKSTAGAAAQVVLIKQQLDPDLDLSTFELGDFGFGAIVINVPDGRSFFSTRVDARATVGLFVDVTAGINASTGLVTWTFTSTDPESFDLPLDVFAGFLPPNQTSPEGEGFVSYFVRSKAALPTGTRLDALASIVFDTNAAIDTPAIFNTIDAAGPSSSVTSLPVTTYSSNFTVNWSGNDDTGGSGIGTYDVFVSDNGGVFALFQQATTTITAIFAGQFDHTYAFYSVATDNVGHREAIPATPDVTTTIRRFLPPVITGPDAVTQFQRPTITWTPVDGAVKYQIWIKNQSTNVNPFLQTTRSSTAFYPTSDLGIGRYNVWIRSVSATGVFSESTPQYNFQITTRAIFSVIPRNQTTTTPTLTWSPLVGAVKYDVWIDNLSTGQQQIVRNRNVTGTSLTVATALPMGSYRAWVRGLDASGVFAEWSRPIDFNVLPVVTVIGPVNSTFDRTPTFTWNAVPGAVGYDLVLLNAHSVVVSNPKNIVGTSFTQPTDLPVGLYGWRVFAVSANVQRSPSATTVEFFVGGRSTLLTPSGTTSDTKPTFRWTPVDGVARHELLVTRTDVPIRGIIDEENLTGTSHIPDKPLPTGTYRAWVRAVSTTGEESPYSFQVNFSIVAATDMPRSGLAPEDSLLTSLAVLDSELNDSKQRPSSDARTQSSAPFLPRAASSDSSVNRDQLASIAAASGQRDQPDTILQRTRTSFPVVSCISACRFRPESGALFRSEL